MSSVGRTLHTFLGHLPEIVRRSWTGTWRDDVPFYAAGIAFHSLFSIFALLFLFSLLLGLFGADPANLHRIARFMEGMMPRRAAELIETAVGTVRNPVPGRLLPVAILATLWTASNVVQAVIHSLHRIYHLADWRPAWQTRLMALAVVGGASLLLVAGFVLLVFGEDLSSGLAAVERARGEVVFWLLALKQAVSLVIVFLGVLLIYWLAPSFKHQRRVSWPGALLFTVSWIVATLGFNVYLREVAVYDRIYGPAATVVVMLVWVYLSAFLALLGGEVNAAVDRIQEDLERERPA